MFDINVIASLKLMGIKEFWLNVLAPIPLNIASSNMCYTSLTCVIQVALFLYSSSDYLSLKIMHTYLEYVELTILVKCIHDVLHKLKESLSDLKK